MAVGAGSIKRAAKLNAAAEETIVKASVKAIAEDITVQETAAAPEKAKGTAGTKATPKKATTAGTKAAPKKATAAETKAAPRKKVSAGTKEISKKESGNEVCHLTEELPIYLL